MSHFLDIVGCCKLTEAKSYEGVYSFTGLYTSITIVQSYTGKHHMFVAVCIFTSVQCQRQQMSDIFSGIALYYGDNDFITQTFDFIACLRHSVCV